MSINVIKRANIKEAVNKVELRKLGENDLIVTKTNKEKYADDIIAVSQFGVRDGKIFKCMGNHCNGCLFDTGEACYIQRKRWLDASVDIPLWKRDELVKIASGIYHIHSYDSKNRLVAVYCGGRDSRTAYDKEDYFVVPEEICERIDL